jgi:hypothetical protein
MPNYSRLVKVISRSRRCNGRGIPRIAGKGDPLWKREEGTSCSKQRPREIWVVKTPHASAVGLCCNLQSASASANADGDFFCFPLCSALTRLRTVVVRRCISLSPFFLSWYLETAPNRFCIS